ncbi:hypothetical protein MAQ5080_02893 [Marinomonas aquimarina]|uniref:Uncharacterized protein n=1 Tax=Marinomonas aquimarina TaxID=295068 RepID=A0A1A8TP62_9GAMM|nr:hypothetical protein MAQ5080_02893 [Marinomonas aquimarina]
MAAYPSRHQWMARGDAPLQLPVQPGVGAPALEPAQDAAADEDAQGHAQDDERRRDGDRAEHPGQRRADQQAGGAGQAAADPQFVGGEAAHDNRVAVEPMRKERDRPVRTDVLLLGHTGLALQDAGGFGEQPDADHEQHGTDRDGEAKLAPGLAAGVDFRVGAVGVVADADEHRRHDQEGYEHDDVVAVVPDRFHDAVAGAAGRVFQLRQALRERQRGQRGGAQCHSGALGKAGMEDAVLHGRAFQVRRGGRSSGRGTSRRSGCRRRGTGAG